MKLTQYLLLTAIVIIATYYVTDWIGTSIQTQARITSKAISGSVKR